MTTSSQIASINLLEYDIIHQVKYFYRQAGGRFVVGYPKQHDGDVPFRNGLTQYYPLYQNHDSESNNKIIPDYGIEVHVANVTGSQAYAPDTNHPMILYGFSDGGNSVSVIPNSQNYVAPGFRLPFLPTPIYIHGCATIGTCRQSPFIPIEQSEYSLYYDILAGLTNQYRNGTIDRVLYDTWNGLTDWGSVMFTKSFGIHPFQKEVISFGSVSGILSVCVPPGGQFWFGLTGSDAGNKAADYRRLTSKDEGIFIAPQWYSYTILIASGIATFNIQDEKIETYSSNTALYPKVGKSTSLCSTDVEIGDL